MVEFLRVLGRLCLNVEVIFRVIIAGFCWFTDFLGLKVGHFYHNGNCEEVTVYT